MAKLLLYKFEKWQYLIAAIWKEWYNNYIKKL